MEKNLSVTDIMEWDPTNPQTDQLYKFKEILLAPSIPKREKNRKSNLRMERSFLYGRYLGIKEFGHKFIGKKITIKENMVKLSGDHYYFYLPMGSSKN